MSEQDGVQPAEEIGWFGKLITFRGKISQGKYLLGLLGELGILFVGVMAVAGLNNPTGAGSGAVFLASVFPLIAIYFHMCLVTARMRDIGVAYPVPLGILVASLPFVWVYLTIEYIEYTWLLILIGFVVLYFGPFIPKSKAAQAPQL